MTIRRDPDTGKVTRADDEAPAASPHAQYLESEKAKLLAASARPAPGQPAPEPREGARQPLVLDDIRDLETREQVRRFIERGTDGTDSTPEQGARFVCCELISAGWPDARINALVIDAALPISRFFREGGGDPERRAKYFIS